MKKILILAFSLVSLTATAQNVFKSIILQNATASDTATTTGRIFYNPTVNRFSLIENGVSKHFISSVFGRKANSITAQSGDYNISQITNGLSNSLNAGRLFIGNVSNVATGVALSQDALLSSSGALTVQGLNGTLLSTLPTGILKVTTTTGAVGTALVTDFPTLNQNTTGSAATLSPGRNINGVLFDGSANISINLNNSLSISAELISGGASSFNGSAAKSIGIQPSSVVNSMLANASISIAGNSQALGTSVTLDQITGVASNGYVKRTGANTLTNVASIPNADLTNSTISIAGNSQALGTSVTLDQITGVASNGIVKRTGANTLAIASNSDVWLSGSGATLGALNTIASTTPNGLNFNSIFTASANSQYALLFDGTLTTRGTASDAFAGIQFKHIINPGATTQNLTGVTIDATFNLKGAASTFGNLLSNTTSGCTNGTTTAYSGYTYTNQDGTGATGTGATFNVTVSGNIISSIAVNAGGSGYKIGDKFLFNGSAFGGTGSVYLELVTLSSMSLSTNSSPFRVINRIYVPGNIAATPLNKFIDLQTVDATGTPQTRIYLGFYNNGGSGATSSYGDQFGEVFSTNASAISFVRAVSTSAATTFGGALTTKEISYNGTNQGTGTSLAFLTSSVGQRFSVPSQSFTGFTTSNTITSGLPATGSITNAGTGYTNGSYPSVTATGGTGSGLVFASITVSGGVVTSASMSANNAVNYKVGDVISGSFGGGSGFQYTLSAVDFSGGVFASLRNIQTITDNGYGGSIYATVYDKRTITQNNTAGTPYFTSLETNITVSSGTPNIYPILIRNSTGLNGFGVGASLPVSTVDVIGSFGRAITISTGNLTLDATHGTIIIQSGTNTYTLPSASGAIRRIYKLVNQTGNVQTISTYKDKSNASQTTIAANSSLELQPDGTNWYQLN